MWLVEAVDAIYNHSLNTLKDLYLLVRCIFRVNYCQSTRAKVFNSYAKTSTSPAFGLPRCDSRFVG